MTYTRYLFTVTVMLFATTYGSGTYNSLNYNGTNAPGGQTGPFGLPVTGATMAVLGAAMLAIAAGLGMWLWQRRRKKLQSN